MYVVDNAVINTNVHVSLLCTDFHTFGPRTEAASAHSCSKFFQSGDNGFDKDIKAFLGSKRKSKRLAQCSHT